jgi:hypothetical protein
MRRALLSTLAAMVLLVPPAALSAQSAVLDGVRYTPPPGYTLDPSRSDSTLVVLRDPRNNTYLFVATLAPDRHRVEVVDRILGRLGSAAGATQAFRWRAARSAPISPSEVYHQQRQGSDGSTGMVVQFRHFRHAGRDILTGAAFPLDGDEAAMALQAPLPIISVPAYEGSARLIGSLLGEIPPAAKVPLVFHGVGFGGAGAPADPQAAARTVPKAPARTDPEAPAVQAVYDAYRAALRARDGAAGARLVAAPTLEYYADMQWLALYGSAEAVRAQPPIDRLTVLTMRHRVEPERLRGMTARQLLEVAVSEGWAGTGSPAAEKSGDVRVDSSVATMKVTVSGTTRSSETSFLRQEDGWRLDLLPQVLLLGWALELAAKRTGVAEDDFLLSTLTRSTGRAPSEQIWNPLFPRPGSGR